MAFKVVREAKRTIPPLPKTARGFGIHIDGTTAGGKRLIYTNGRFVVIRSLEDQFEATVFGGHQCNVNVAKFSPNGEWVASGDCQGNVIVWGARTQTAKNQLRANNSVLDISWGADNSQIIAAGDGGDGYFAKVFRIDSSNSIGEISGHSKKILSCAVKPSKPHFIATASEDFSVNTYKGVPYRHQKTQRLFKNYPNCVRYNRAGDAFAAVGSDRRICLFGGEGELLKQVDAKAEGAHKGSIYSCCFSPDGAKLLTSSGDKTLKVWDAASLSCEHTFSAGGRVEDMQVSCLWLEGFIVSVSLSGAINFFEEGEGAPSRTWNGHQDAIRSIAVHPSGKRLFSAGIDGKIVGWDLERSVSTFFSGGHDGKPIVAMDVSSDGDKIFSVGFDDNFCVSDVEDKKTEFLSNLDGQPTCIASSKTSPTILAAATVKNTLFYTTNGSSFKSEKLESRTNTIAFSPKKNDLAVGGEDKKVRIYFVSETGLDLKLTIDKHISEITFVGYSENGDYLITAGKQGKIFVWDTSSDFSKPLNSRGWKFHNSVVTSAACKPGFEVVATGSKDEQIIKWSNPTKGNQAKRAFVNPAHLSGVNILKTLDESTFVSAGEDKCIRIWEF